MKRGVPVWMIVVGLAVVAGVVAITFAITGDGSEGDAEVDTTSWAEVTAAAEGQTVRLWMWGGEAALNSYIDNEVATAAQEAGVTLERVPIDDTASAIARLATEAEAGTDDGAIDLLWVNGKNFEQGADAGLWLTNWVQQLPNAALLDPDDATLWNDFGVPTLGQEMPWSRAAFVFAYDSASVKEPPRSFDELLTYARANPGRIAYPAPPDFTGSALVRQAVQALGEDAAFELLRELDPLLWRSGETYPVDQAEVEQLFAAGEIDLAMSYNPNFVDVAVQRGSFPETVQPYVFESGTLQNVSFLAIPARASSPHAAMVVADLMLSPELQTTKLDLVGIPPVLPAAELDVDTSGASAFRLAEFGTPLEELPADRVPEIDRRWIAEVAE